MTKEEVDKLSEELGELSENEKQSKERMKEIAHILVSYYMGGGKTVKGAEKKSAEDDPKNTA